MTPNENSENVSTRPTQENDKAPSKPSDSSNPSDEDDESNPYIVAAPLCIGGLAYWSIWGVWRRILILNTVKSGLEAATTTVSTTAAATDTTTHTMEHRATNATNKAVNRIRVVSLIIPPLFTGMGTWLGLRVSKAAMKLWKKRVSKIKDSSVPQSSSSKASLGTWLFFGGIGTMAGLATGINWSLGLSMIIGNRAAIAFVFDEVELVLARWKWGKWAMRMIQVMRYLFFRQKK